MSSLETRVQFPAGEMFKMPGLVSFFLLLYAAGTAFSVAH